MADWIDNYRLVGAAKDKAVKRTAEGVTEITNEDAVGKIEFNNGSERYEGGFWDYHGPK